MEKKPEEVRVESEVCFKCGTEMVERMWNYSATGYTIIHECNFCGTFYKETAVYAYHHGEVEFEEIERPVDLDDLYD